jgi:hypothetical protein
MRTVSERKLCVNIRKAFSCMREVDDAQPSPKHIESIDMRPYGLVTARMKRSYGRRIFHQRQCGGKEKRSYFVWHLHQWSPAPSPFPKTSDLKFCAWGQVFVCLRSTEGASTEMVTHLVSRHCSSYPQPSLARCVSLRGVSDAYWCHQSVFEWYSASGLKLLVGGATGPMSGQNAGCRYRNRT